VAQSLPGVTLRYGCEFLSLEQDATGVTARVRNGAGPVAAVRAAYLVAATAARAEYGTSSASACAARATFWQLRQALYRCDDLYGRIPIGNGPGKGRITHVADDSGDVPDHAGFDAALDLHSIVDKDEDMARQFERTVGVPVKYDLPHVGEWKQNLLLADHYGKGRVFPRRRLGPSRHPDRRIRNETPASAMLDLSWKLAGSLRGWGGPDLLASYESSAGRSAIAMSAPRAMPRLPAQVARPVSARYPRPDRRGTGGERASRRSGRHRAAQDQTR